uniref:Coat protein n=1 Tax=uncultured marine virus TaxID=186617 RepID=S4TF19_9VIRU|nr:hypothetical protein [uncultured marine virus]
MPLDRTPTLILSDTKSRTKSARTKRSSARRNVITGRRSGFPHPAPSRVPQGALETKSQKFANTEYDLLAGGVATHINSITQGTGNANRIGYKIRNTAVHLKGQFSCAQGGPRSAVAGYYLVWDKSPNLALAATSDVFNINAGAGYDMSNTFPIDNDRFVVLKSVRRTLTNSNAGRNVVLVDDFIKLPATCTTGFVKGNTTGGIANTQTGALLLMPYRSVTETAGDDKVALNVTMELFFAEA